MLVETDVEWVWSLRGRGLGVCMQCHNNESTAGAYASMEMPKLHNIKLAFIHTLFMIIMINIFNFAACRIQGKLEEWVMIDDDCC